MDNQFDLLVIGGGSGGLATAQRAAEYGARAAVIESGRLGGTCVNVGCVPKKIMWNAAGLAHALADAPDYGFSVRDASLDFRLLKRKRDEGVAWLNELYAKNLVKRQVTLVRGRARFKGPGEVLVEGATLKAAHIVIATGGQPKVPDLPGSELGITSDGYFDLEHRPDHIALVGSGYIAAEIAGTLRALGSQVTIVTRGDGVLREFDPLIREHLTRCMRDEGIEIIENTHPTALARSGRRLVLHAGPRRVGEFDTVLWAIGRQPRTANLGLDTVGVRTGKQGEILTDEWQNTNVGGIYSIGDVTGRIALTPVAIAAGRRLADRVFGGQPQRKLDYAMIPSVVFSHPPVGCVGMTEPEARALHGDAVRVFSTTFLPLYHGLTTAKPRTAMKLVTLGEEQRVIGCHVVGPGADEMLQGFAIAVRMGATKRDFDDTVAIHPTSAEEMVTMR